MVQELLFLLSLCRKVAACHPILTLRNLPLVAAALKGRTEFDFSFFRSRNHLTLYSMTLGLLDVLRPHVFRQEYRQSMEEVLKCFFDMLRAYFDRRESFVGVIDKLFIFLNDYLEVAPVAAARFVRSLGEGLSVVQKALPNMASLKAVVSSLGLDSVSSSTATALHCASSSNYSQQARRDADADSARLAAAIRAAKTDEETASALKEANDACQGGAGARATILERLSPEICANLSHPCEQVRYQAYNLLLKCMRFSPRTPVTRELSGAYIRCLESSDPCVAQSALEKLPDAVVLAQESLVDIMTAAFNLGIHGGLNVTNQITDTVNLLNSSLGY